MAYPQHIHQLKKLTALPPNDVHQLMLDTRWADGLRGIASLFVVSSHLTLCFARRLILPCCGDDEKTPLLWQNPPFRLVAMGHSWVAIFFILLGFVNALKPLKLSRQNKLDTALANLAQASFRRTFRLMLPAGAATIISWFICQLGFYTTAHRGDAYWMLTYTPWPSNSWADAVVDLLHALKYTWMFWTDNPYDQPQWALVYLLYGSMVVFTSLLITLAMRPPWRASAIVLFTVWSLDWTRLIRDPLVPASVFAGILLSELSLTSLPLQLVSYSPFISPPLIITGLFLMSHPSDFTDKAGWSNFLQQWGMSHFPKTLHNEMNRTWGSIGAVMLILAVLLSPHLRRLLAAKPLTWLGKVSFPIYLLHGMFIRSVLAWMAFKSEPAEFQTDHGPERRYPQRSSMALWFAIAVSMGCMLVASHYWAMKVEPIFGKITARLERLMVAGKDEPSTMRGGIGNGSMVLPVRKD